jgi:hypothetical protein
MFLTMGCGSGSSIEARKIAAFVALANKFCGEVSTHRAEAPVRKEADFAKPDAGVGRVAAGQG